MHTLASRVVAPAEPHIDEFGVLHRGTQWVALPPIEERLASVLLLREGYVVGRRTLARAAWPTNRAPKERSIDSRISLLRRRVAPLRIRIRTVRGQGFVLEVEERSPAS
ncbi:MAG TPA: winged helix-turn-helix domain-containing protein [Acidimicrobiia bacterium]|nr:winged helix-turn-helix domain-containing protein [Acidimicrobiia bacterium]